MLTAQNISYYKDFDKNLNIETIDNVEFKTYKKTINDGLNTFNYWFKIDDFKSKNNYIQFKNAHITNAIAYQSNLPIKTEEFERHTTFKITNPETVYIKVNITKEAYIPIKVSTTTNFQYNEKKQILFTGFYYGFALVILLINLFYFLNFRDYTFLYYSCFLLTITIALFISDGLLNLLGVTQTMIDFIETSDHFLVSVTALIFATSYLQIENYYPKLKYLSLVLVIIIGILSVCYVANFNFKYFIYLETLVFIVCLIYIIAAGFLFKRNNFSKIFLLAYSFILVLGFCYYVSKLYGFSICEITSNQVKIGGIIEMLVLSYAVVYRTKALKIENKEIRNAIVNYIKEINELSKTVNKQTVKKTIKNRKTLLSFRETEIMQLIAKGQTNKEIALTLHISENTVKYHVKNIYTKLNIKSRKEIPVIINK
ncbi:MAG: hypothetical protein BM549_07095 [Lacinutrix sp. MedPE-SW]|nr:MAG: hypothetical protein BM549_07095 [Lacinutrix sp. MedPE-SW]